MEDDTQLMDFRDSRQGIVKSGDNDNRIIDHGGNHNDDDDDLLPDDSEYSEYQSDDLTEPPPPPPKTGFVKALIDSTIPRDFIDQSVGIVKGEYMVEKKSLLNHAATSDQYDLFSSSRRFLTKAAKQLEGKE